MRRNALSLALVALLPAAPPVLAQEAATLTVTGQGRVAAVPDMATLQVGVEARGADAAQAMDNVSATMEGLLAVLDEMQVAERDRQSSNLSLDMIYRNGSVSPDARDGEYRARNTLSVTLRDMERLGNVLQALLDEGANDFSGLSFGLQEPRPVEDEARRLAVADARDKAELYAGAAGVTLGPILSIAEGGTGGGPNPMLGMARMAASAEAMPVAAGETEVRADVTIVWEIAEE